MTPTIYGFTGHIDNKNINVVGNLSTKGPKEGKMRSLVSCLFFVYFELVDGLKI